MRFTVAVIGLGSMGSMTLWQLARRGIAVVGFEQFRLGHANGAFSGETRMFRTAYTNGPHWTPALRLAKQLWRELEQASGLPLLDLNGFVSIGDPEGERMRQLLDSASAAELAVELLGAAEAKRRFPALGVQEGEIALFDPDGGLIKPERAVMAAITEAQACGATVHQACGVQSVRPLGSHISVATDRGVFEVDKVVVTAGAWSAAFLGDGFVTPHRVALHWFLSRTPALFEPAVFPPHIRYEQRRALCLFSSQDRTLVKAAIGGALGALADPLQARTAPADELPILREAVARHYPDLWPDPVRSESYADGFSTDGNPMVGALPDTPGIIVGAGFSAHGFKFAPVIGAALADFAIDGRTELPVDHLRPSRFNWAANGQPRDPAAPA